jgi:hypothetical protein
MRTRRPSFFREGVGFGNRLLASGSHALQRLLAFISRRQWHVGVVTLLQGSPVTVAGPLRNRTAFRVSRNGQLGSVIPRTARHVNNERHLPASPQLLTRKRRTW